MVVSGQSICNGVYFQSASGSIPEYDSRNNYYDRFDSLADYCYFASSFCHVLAMTVASRAGGIQDIPPFLSIDTMAENIKFKV